MVVEAPRKLGFAESIQVTISAALQTENFQDLSFNDKNRLYSVGFALADYLIRGTESSELTFLGVCTDVERIGIELDTIGEFSSRIVAALEHNGYLNNDN